MWAACRMTNNEHWCRLVFANVECDDWNFLLLQCSPCYLGVNTAWNRNKVTRIYMLQFRNNKQHTYAWFFFLFWFDLTRHFLILLLVRIGFCIGPYSPWYLNYWPRPLQNVFLTISIPSSLATVVLLAFYWQQLMQRKRLTVTNFISTKAKIPILLIIALLCIFEAITSSIRAIGIRGEEGASAAINNVITANEFVHFLSSCPLLTYLPLPLHYRIIYLVCVVLMAIYYAYVTAKVLRFIKNLKRLKRSDRILRKVRYVAHKFQSLMI